MAQATDLMLDLKTGYLVGAVPAKTADRRSSSPPGWGLVVIMVLIYVLHQAYGLGSERLPAPQARRWPA